MSQDDSYSSLSVYRALVDNHLSYLVEAVPGYMYVKDINSVYLACNQGFAKAAGLSDPKEVIGKTDYDLAWGETEANVFRRGDMEVLNGHHKINFEETQHQADGKERTVLANKVPLYDKDKKIVGVLGTYVDITEFKETNKNLLKAKEKAEEANRLKSDFVANVSHDFRTPLSTVLGMAEAALLVDSLDRYRESVSTILSSGKHLLGLVEDIIEYSQLEQNQYRSKLSENLFDDLVVDIEKVVRSNAERKKINLIIDNQVNKNTVIKADCKALKRVIINLVDNAIKFTEKGSVELGLSQVNDEDKIGSAHIVISVKDTGVGIRKNDQEKIFDRFARLAPSYMNQHVSTGLGLTIVRQLIEALNGSISLTSSAGKGSEFTCIVPVFTSEKPSVEEQDQVSPELIAIKEGCKKILVVEDVVQIQRVLELLLKELGVVVTFAGCGEEALTKNFNDYDLVLMDLGLGDMTGIDVIKKAGEKYKIKTPVVALTAHAGKNDKVECMGSGMKGFITKPIFLDDLRNIVEEFC